MRTLGPVQRPRPGSEQSEWLTQCKVAPAPRNARAGAGGRAGSSHVVWASASSLAGPGSNQRGCRAVEEDGESRRGEASGEEAEHVAKKRRPVVGWAEPRACLPVSGLASRLP